MNISKWIKRNIPAQNGKTVAISGATGGIGTHLTLHLASLGANLVLLNRNETKSRALIAEVNRAYPDIKCTHITMDLEDPDSVKSATAALAEIVPDTLILNAGAYAIPRHKCQTGFDNVFQINFLSPYFLASKLKPLMDAKGGKIIAVSSIAHNYSKINAKDVDFSTCKKSSFVYGNSKRFLTYTLHDLCKDDNNLAIVHPGITLTNITAHYPKIVLRLIKWPMKIFFPSPKKAALCLLMGLAQNTSFGTWIGPKAFNVWGAPTKKRLPKASEEEIKSIIALGNDALKIMENC